MAGEGMTLAGIRRIFELEIQVADLRRQLAQLQAREQLSPPALPSTAGNLRYVK
jgi:hypothetical protein